MNFILNVGVKPELGKYLNDKIKISNQVALLMAGVGLCYTLFSIFFYPVLTIYPAFCILFSFGAIAFNNLGLYTISRFILSTLLLFLASLYHGFLVQPGEGMISSMLVIEVALSVIPWVLIDFRERTLLTVALITCYTLIFIQPWANEVLSIQLDSTMFREGYLDTASYAFGVLILVSCLFFMQNKNHISEKQNESLLADINSKNEEMNDQRLALEKNLKEIEIARSMEEKQNWIAKGVADISELLQQDKNTDIHNSLLREIVKYLEANQGAIYLVNDENDDQIYLEMVACYAFDRKKFLTKKINPGQGLIGQCYLEKEPIILKDVPEEFVNITSGLGEALPTFIAIVPVLQETKVTGVIEVALFHELEKYQLEFLTKIGNNIASYFASNSMNIKTKELLEQSQIQMEQLRAQEEEMRQNMEELQATQEEMQRKEREYLERISQLEQVPSQ